jgi:hypothetical protein
LADAKEKDVVNLKNWLSGNGCIAREESDYLAKAYDLGTLDSHSEDIRHNLESFLEETAIWIDTKLLMVSDQKNNGNDSAAYHAGSDSVHLPSACDTELLPMTRFSSLDHG